MQMQRNISGFLPPFVLTELARRNPEEAELYLDSLTQTASLWTKGQSLIVPIGSAQAVRTTYDAQGRYSLPGKKVRGENDPPVADEIVNRAHEFAGLVRGYYREVHGRNSIDGNGMALDSSVHYGNRYNNAFWNGKSMTYGDGDGSIFLTFVLLDVVGHELTHGVTEFTSGLEYYDQSGALNEHCSDVFGVLVEQWSKKQTADQATWLVGAGLFTSRIKGRALRDMLNPGTAYDDPRLGKDPQPAHMRDYVHTNSDNGGVHYNSGIPNRAFALFARAIGGYAWEKAGKIWFATRNQVKSDCNFQQFANKSVEVAKVSFPETVAQLKDAWGQVGITVS